MRLLLAFILLTSPAARAQIFADVSTTLGDFTIELDHVNAPRSVANFIRLAKGSTPWVHSDTGQVHFNTPYYNGIVFHRVMADFMSQTGSQRGDGSDGPGYVFRDEVENGIAHARHSVSMANSGPNTNGSQFFITDIATTWLDGKHTVFGSISSGGDVVDAINDVPTTGTVPDTPVVIESITIRRIGAAAQAFNEHDQDLPTISAPRVGLHHNGTGATLEFPQPTRSEATVFNSSDGRSWSPLKRYIDDGGTAADTWDLSAVTEGVPMCLFNTSVAEYPVGTLRIDSLSGWSLTANLVGDGRDGWGVDKTGVDYGIVSFSFDDATGDTYTYGAGSGDITSYEYTPAVSGGVLLVYSDGLVPLLFKLGLDSSAQGVITGRYTGTIYLSDPILGYNQVPSRGEITMEQ